MKAFGIVIVALVIGTAVPAAAQSAAPSGKRWVFGGGALWQSAAPEATDSLQFTAFSESGTLDTVFTPKSWIGFDMGVAARVARSFGLGASLSFYAPSQDADAGGTLTASIPHPFIAGMPRVVSLPADMRRKELAVHTNALYFLEPSERLLVTVGGGLSIYRANQLFVTGIEYHEETPALPTTAVVTDVDHLSASGTGLGLNGTVEATWSLDRNVGIGALARYARGTVTFSPGGRDVETPTGGLHLGLGIRFRY